MKTEQSGTGYELAKCPACDGSGQDKRARDGICGPCKGSGSVLVPRRKD